jgi:hypothetical protein
MKPKYFISLYASGCWIPEEDEVGIVYYNGDEESLLLEAYRISKEKQTACRIHMVTDTVIAHFGQQFGKQ